MFGFRVLILTFSVFTAVTFALERPAEVRYQWKYLNFTWPSVDVYEKAVADGDYVPRNNVLSGMKIWKGRLYLAIPRLRHGVPVTLAVIPLKPVRGNRSPNLKPFPNWEMQKPGNCSSFQAVRKMEIDPLGRMWILDNGHYNLFDGNKVRCPARLVIVDLENDGKILMNFEFPKNLMNPITNLITDIVLDHTDGGYAYMPNADPLKPSIVVFSLEQKKSWSFTHKSMYLTAPIIKIKNERALFAPFNADGIALSPASGESQRLVYYAPLASFQLFSIPTDVLKKSSGREFGSEVKLVGKKPSQSDGMIISADGELYFGLLSDNQVSKWNISDPPFSENQQRVFKDDINLVWTDTFAIDQKKNMWASTNRLDKSLLLFNHLDINQVNFRVVKLAQLNVLNYQYYSNGTAPKWKKI